MGNLFQQTFGVNESYSFEEISFQTQPFISKAKTLRYLYQSNGSPVGVWGMHKIDISENPSSKRTAGISMIKPNAKHMVPMVHTLFSLIKSKPSPPSFLKPRYDAVYNKRPYQTSKEIEMV